LNANFILEFRSHSAAHGIQKVAIEEQTKIANNSQVTAGFCIAGYNIRTRSSVITLDAK